MKTEQKKLTVQDLYDMENRREWLGFGYLGTRYQAKDNLRAAMDKKVIQHANAQGWTADELFDWANSRNGRHAADTLSDGPIKGLQERYTRALGWTVMDLPRD